MSKNLIEIVSDLSKKPEILNFCSCYSKDDLFTIIELILSSTFLLIRETFDSVPSLTSVLSLLSQVFSYYQNQSSLKTLENQLQGLKSRVKHFESSTSQKARKLKHSSNSENQVFTESNHFKASSDWRKGDSTVFKRSSSDTVKGLKTRKIKPETELETAIYPEWWLNMRENSQKTIRVSINDQKLAKKSETRDKKTKEHSRSKNEKAVEANIESSQSSTSEKSKKYRKNTKKPKENPENPEIVILPESHSSSSNSAFFPSAEMKKFYQGEFKRLFGNSLQG